MYRVYLHEFCKVVTSGDNQGGGNNKVYLHEFCKVVTSDRAVHLFGRGVLT